MEISVIIPIYNTEEYLEECFKSVLNQSIDQSKLEVILVNDGSTDGSKDIALKYCSGRKNWNLIDQKNQGQSVSRNKGLDIAKGKYITFLDSDDILTPDALDTMYQRAEKYQVDLVIARLKSFNSLGEFSYYSDKYINNVIKFNLEENFKIIKAASPCAKLYLKEMIKDIHFIPNLIHEDVYFSITSAIKSEKISSMDKTVYLRRIREGENTSIMQNLNYKTFGDLLKNYSKVLMLDIKPNLKNKIDYYLLKTLTFYKYQNLKRSEYRKANKAIFSFINQMDKSFRLLPKIVFFVLYDRYIWLKKVVRHG